MNPLLDFSGLPRFADFKTELVTPAVDHRLAENRALIGDIFQVAAKLAREQGIAESGYRVVVNSGADAGQSVLHIHYHLLGGRQLGWPPG